MGDERLFICKTFTIQQSHAAMKVGTDSDLLGALSAGGKRIMDIGTGTGVLSLMLAQRCPDANITAIEVDDGAVIDAERNFNVSIYADRLTLHHESFQEYLEDEDIGYKGKDFVPFDCVVCNPPYFDRSLECPDPSKTRARHTSSLPFSVLIEGTYAILADDGVFSVCIPPEVYDDFTSLCAKIGLSLMEEHAVQTVPDRPVKRYVLVFKKGNVDEIRRNVYCMRNLDRSRSDWYLELMKLFHVSPSSQKPPKPNN